MKNLGTNFLIILMVLLSSYSAFSVEGWTTRSYKQYGILLNSDTVVEVTTKNGVKPVRGITTELIQKARLTPYKTQAYSIKKENFQIESVFWYKYDKTKKSLFARKNGTIAVILNPKKKPSGEHFNWWLLVISFLTFASLVTIWKRLSPAWILYSLGLVGVYCSLIHIYSMEYYMYLIVSVIVLQLLVVLIFKEAVKQFKLINLSSIIIFVTSFILFWLSV